MENDTVALRGPQEKSRYELLELQALIVEDDRNESLLVL